MSRAIRNQIFNLKEGTAGKGGASDPIQDLVDEYVANVTAAGHTVGEASPYTKLYGFFNDLVSSSDWADASCYFYAHEMGYRGVDDGGTTRIRQAYPLKKVGASWITSTDIDGGLINAARRPARSATTIWGSADVRRWIGQAGINYGTDSFEIEIKANFLAVNGQTHEFVRGSNAGGNSFIFSGLTNNRIQFSAFNNANTLEAQVNWGAGVLITDADVTIKLIVTRTGGATFVAEVLIDNVSKGTTSGNYTGNFTNLFLGADTGGVYSFKKFEWAKVNKL